MVLAVLFRRFRLLVHALPTNPTNQNLHQLAVGCKETQFYILPYCSLRAGSLGEREPARIPMIFTCMRPIFGRRALIG